MTSLVQDHSLVFNNIDLSQGMVEMLCWVPPEIAVLAALFLFCMSSESKGLTGKQG